MASGTQAVEALDTVKQDSTEPEPTIPQTSSSLEDQGPVESNDTTHDQQISNKEAELDEGKEVIGEADLIPEHIPSVGPETVDKLVTGVLGHVLPDFQKAKSNLSELTENQRILIETVQQENNKFNESKALQEVIDVMYQAREYHTKLLNIKQDMVMLHEKSAKLKKRALKIQQQKQKEALQREQDRERELEKERLLIAKPAKSQ